MCRQNQLRGWLLIAFGAGLLLGRWLESGFIAWCLGIGLIAFGIVVLTKKR